MTYAHFRRLGSLLAVAITAACGTVAGNPKKPSDGTPPPSVMVYQLPLIDFSLPDDATSDDGNELLLAQGFDQNKSLLTVGARRLDLATRRVNALSERVNAIVTSEREAGNTDETLTFAARGGDGKLSAKIGPAATDDDGMAYEAVICHTDKPFVWFRWSEDGKHVKLTRDFAVSDEQAEVFSLTSALDIVVGETTVIEATHQGEAKNDALPNPEGNGVTEHTRAERLASGDINLKATADRYAELPEDGAFSGDSYVTGRLVPTGVTLPSGKSQFDTEFVGYFKGFKLLCAAGFDESADDLWSPDKVGPRFCLGRPKGAKLFESFDQFVETAQGLASVGIIPAAALRRVALPDGLACD
jgi:hypothetical protein